MLMRTTPGRGDKASAGWKAQSNYVFPPNLCIQPHKNSSPISHFDNSSLASCRNIITGSQFNICNLPAQRMLCICLTTASRGFGALYTESYAIILSIVNRKKSIYPSFLKSTNIHVSVSACLPPLLPFIFLILLVLLVPLFFLLLFTSCVYCHFDQLG